MTISELIKELKLIQASKGDLEVLNSGDYQPAGMDCRISKVSIALQGFKFVCHLEAKEYELDE